MTNENNQPNTENTQPNTLLRLINNSNNIKASLLA
jgi:hypothetical protein